MQCDQARLFDISRGFARLRISLGSAPHHKPHQEQGRGRCLGRQKERHAESGAEVFTKSRANNTDGGSESGTCTSTNSGAEGSTESVCRVGHRERQRQQLEDRNAMDHHQPACTNIGCCQAELSQAEQETALRSEPSPRCQGPCRAPPSGPCLSVHDEFVGRTQGTRCPRAPGRSTSAAGSTAAQAAPRPRGTANARLQRAAAASLHLRSLRSSGCALGSDGTAWPRVVTNQPLAMLALEWPRSGPCSLKAQHRLHEPWPTGPRDELLRYSSAH